MFHAGVSPSLQPKFKHLTFKGRITQTVKNLLLKSSAAEYGECPPTTIVFKFVHESSHTNHVDHHRT